MPLCQRQDLVLGGDFLVLQDPTLGLVNDPRGQFHPLPQFDGQVLRPVVLALLLQSPGPLLSAQYRIPRDLQQLFVQGPALTKPRVIGQGHGHRRGAVQLLPAQIQEVTDGADVNRPV